jgi:tetratricopeptide (TPR) repeat protein
MTTTKTSYSVISLEEAAPAAAQGGFGLGTATDPDAGQRGRVYVRRDLDIGSFGVNAFYQATSGAWVIGEHDELAPGASGHEELYVVVEGHCTFAVDGEEVDAPRGTALFVREPAAKRSARATEDGTTVLVVGGRPGEAFEPGPGEALSAFYRLYREKEYEGALSACREALEAHPGNAMILYNIACLESRLGRPDKALEPLGESLAAWPEYKRLAADDDDLAALRDDARFQALVA